jgi:hypothetical protein
MRVYAGRRTEFHPCTSKQLLKWNVKQEEVRFGDLVPKPLYGIVKISALVRVVLIVIIPEHL